MLEDLLASLDLVVVSVLIVALLAVVYLWRRGASHQSSHQAILANLSNENSLLQDRLNTTSEQEKGLKQELQDARDRALQLSRDNARLETLVEERGRAMLRQQESFEVQKKALHAEFETLANRIFDEKGRRFSEHSRESIEGMLKPFREQITEFRNRVDGIHKENSESTGSLYKELEQLRTLNAQMTQDAQSLTTALKGDKKALGSWGEVQLEKSLQLAGLIKGEHYRTQVHLKDEHGKTYFLDFVIDLPDEQHLVIDSKASLLAYDQAVSSHTEEAREAAMADYVQALKNHVKDLSEKNYSRLKGVNSPNFVLMFLPLEAAYIEALKYSPALYEEAYRKSIILVSHTTLVPILKTVSNVWRLQNSQDEALAISDKAGEIYNHVCTLAERLHKLGGSLQSASRHYNSVLTSLVGQQGLHGKVERFQSMSIEANKAMPQMDHLNTEMELDRVERVLTDILPDD